MNYVFPERSLGKCVENLPAGKSEKDARNDVDFNGRYSITSYDGSHFGINGTTFLATVSVTF